MRCVAVELAIVGSGPALHRVRPGTVFEADECPKWARPAPAPEEEVETINPPKPAKPAKAKKKDAAPEGPGPQPEDADPLA